MDEYILTERRRQVSLIAIVAVSVFMFTLDYSMVSVSLPSIARYFNSPLRLVADIPIFYILTATSTLLAFSKLGDLKGYAKVFIAGLVVFLAGSALCGIAGNVRVLLALRIFQALGEAMFSPVGIALITAFLPPGMRGKALGIVTLAQGLGFCAGPVLSGFLNTVLNWRAIFFINIPLGIVTTIFAARLLPKEQKISADKRFDVAGSVLIFAAIATLIYGLNLITTVGLKNPVVLGCFAVSLVSFALLVLWERRIPYPLIDLGLFANRDFTFAAGSAFFCLFAFFGLTFLFPFYLQLVRALPVAEVGTIMVIPSLMMLILAPIAGKISDARGSRWLCVLGMVLGVAAFGAFSFFHVMTGVFTIMCSLAVAGACAGLFLAPNGKLILSHAPPEKQGIASGIYKITMNIGSVLGIAVFPIVLMQTVTTGAAHDHMALAQARLLPEKVMAGFHNAFLFGLVPCALALVFAALAKNKKEPGSSHR